MDATTFSIDQLAAPHPVADRDEATVIPTIPVALLDVSRENELIRDEWDRIVASVFQSGRFVLGPECEQFETAFAKFGEVPHAIGCASGSDALLLQH